jgi:hypothetical protein
MRVASDHGCDPGANGGRAQGDGLPGKRGPIDAIGAID